MISARGVFAAPAATRSLTSWKRNSAHSPPVLSAKGYGVTETGLAARNPPSGLDKLGSIGM
jgi:hypothetical protein